MSNAKKLTSIIVMILLAVQLGACRNGPFTDVSSELETTLRTYEGNVRWGKLQNMYAFLKRDPENPIEVQEGLDNIRITGYELLSPLTQESEMRWRQTVKIDYVLVDRQIVRYVIDEQVWFSEDDGKSWKRELPLPVFN
jgi:hypothetical protein